MPAATCELRFDGALLARGFWLYVWEVSFPDRSKGYFVGRTGDSSSPAAQSPFHSLGLHIHAIVRSTVPGSGGKAKEIDPSECKFHFVAHGPILAEAATLDLHRERRDIAAALAKALAEAMEGAGYRVVNTVRCTKPLDDAKLFRQIKAAFAKHFPRLKAPARIARR